MPNTYFSKPTTPHVATRSHANDVLLFISLLVVSIALIGATIFTYRNAKVFARERMVRAAVLFTSGLESGARHIGPSLIDRVDEFLAEATSEEVHSVALINQEGLVLAQAGELLLSNYAHSTWALNAAVERIVTAGPHVEDMLLIAVPTSLGSRRGDQGRRRDGFHRGRHHNQRRFISRDHALIVALDATEANAPVSQAQVQALFVGVALILAWFIALRWRRTALRARRLEVLARRKETLAALGEMAAVLAHEIRNPLGAIRGHAQLAIRGLDEQERSAKSLQTVIDETSRLSQLVESLLRYARPSPPESESVDIGALIDRVVDLFSEGLFSDSLLSDAAPASGVVVERREGDDNPKVQCDPSQVEQVLINLIRNAIEAQPDGGRCVVGLTVERGDVVIRVDDEGEGVPDESRDTIFGPFVTTRAEGSGLGLAIARQIAEAHGGSLVVEMSELGGASFVLRIPLAEV